MEATTTKAAFQKYPAYKDSGVDWLGELPKNWDEVPLCTLTKLKSVINCSELELLSVYLDLGVIKFSEVEAKRTNVTSQDLSKYQRVDIGDFVLNNQQAWRGSVGVSNHQGIVSPAYLVLELSKKLHTGYANYMFRSGYMVGQYLINSKGVGTIQRNLYWPSLRRARVILPPLPEQTIIAAFLDDKTAKIDRAIAQKEKMISLLKERKQIIIQNAVTKGLDPNAKMKHSGVEWIGEIPEGWEVKRLKSICKTYGRIGFRGYSTSDLVGENEGAITISPSNIQGDFMNFEKCTYLSWAKYHESPEIQIFKNDVLIVKTGSTYGKVGIATNLESAATINPQLLVFKDVLIDNEYLYEILNSSQIQLQINQEVIGSTIPTISENKILNMKAVLPPKEEIPEIMIYIKEVKTKFNKAIQLQEQQIEKLKELKSTLIDSAVTGKIKVS